MEGEILFVTYISLGWHPLLMFIFYLSLIINSHTLYLQYQGSIRLSGFLSHFCGPLRGEENFLLLLHAILRYWEPREAVSSLWSTVNVVILLLCYHLLSYGEQLIDLTSLGKEALGSPIY